MTLFEFKMRDDTPETNNGKKKKAIIALSSIAVVVLLVIMFSAIGSSMRNNMRKTLSGKTISGTFVYNCSSFISRDTHTIHFIDENYCNIYRTFYRDYRYEDDVFKDINESKEYTNVPYEITGGIFGLKFNWDGYVGPGNSAEPFKIVSNSGSISMYTPNFDSHISMSLDEEY